MTEHSVSKDAVKLNRVLVVYKKPRGRPPQNAERPYSDQHHREHESSLNAVERALATRKISFRLIPRDRFHRSPKVDLIITVGGDGTVLAASHVVAGIPVLGVKASPSRSIGFFCAAEGKNIGEFLDAIASGHFAPTPLPMLEGELNGLPLKHRALNDILFASASPADSVSYQLAVKKRSEFQRSSGLWVCAGPGSTAGFRSAGGEPTSITSDRLRFIVREPCPLPDKRYRMLHGILPRSGKLKIVSESGHSVVYVDGKSLRIPVRHKDVLTVRIARTHFNIFLGDSPPQ